MSPFVFVLFGATGDLAINKLYPALFSLFKKGALGQTFHLVGFARRELSDESFRDFVREALAAKNITEVDDFLQNMYYQQGLFDEVDGYTQLIKKLNAFDTAVGACVTRIFYLATPPDNYHAILQHLESTKLSEGCGPYFANPDLIGAKASSSAQGFGRTQSKGKQGSEFTRLAIEKPFGKDLETAKSLDKKLSEIFEEKQIYRVDHYLGKETVQNMLAFRFANGIFDPVWKREHIDHVQITFAEKKGIGKRGKFFDGVGILRDVAQNHLLQLVAAVTMEQPKSFSREDVRDARVKAIQAIECISPENVSTQVVRGQYEEYHEERNVAAESVTETFVAMKFFVNTERFRGVPFYVRTGKKMPKDLVEISIIFTQTCHILFKEYGCPEIGNVLTIRIQPDEGIRLRVIAKIPGTKLALGTVDMKFTYQEDFGNTGADAYEKVLEDILHGDQMLFNRSDELESSWQFITNILKGWELHGSKLFYYKDSEWGPQEAQELIEKDGRKWL